ncbi:hypothetical protein [Sinorhizobium sp. 22678]|uniref:hypothetical protein n=1 Tax=Sinorhizobium sp. 22678 TaxID=3453955 RepID=UPI003F849367
MVAFKWHNASTENDGVVEHCYENDRQGAFRQEDLVAMTCRTWCQSNSNGGFQAIRGMKTKIASTDDFIDQVSRLEFVDREELAFRQFAAALVGSGT